MVLATKHVPSLILLIGYDRIRCLNMYQMELPVSSSADSICGMWARAPCFLFVYRVRRNSQLKCQVSQTLALVIGVT